MKTFREYIEMIDEGLLDTVISHLTYQFVLKKWDFKKSAKGVFYAGEPGVKYYVVKFESGEFTVKMRIESENKTEMLRGNSPEELDTILTQFEEKYSVLGLL